MRRCWSGWACMPASDPESKPKPPLQQTSSAQQRLVADLRQGLHAREQRHLLRTLQLPTGLDLTSNDYLGYATDPRLTAAMQAALELWGNGAGGARLLRGHLAVHAEAEAALASAAGREAALLFSSGWAANVGLLTALCGPADRVVSDALNHASLIDAMRLSRAERVLVPHLDLQAYQTALTQPWTSGRTFVVVESVYSMDGDLAPLAELAELCAAHDALLIVDEAHATGLYGHPDRYGATGRVEALGLQDAVLATVHTGGKALGVGGAAVAGPAALIGHLVNHARSFVFSTGVPPVVAAGWTAALAMAVADRDEVAALHVRAARLRGRLSPTAQSAGAGSGSGSGTGSGSGSGSGIPLGSCIIPVVLGSSARALAVASRLQAQGYDVRAVRPPTVPECTARLRLCVHKGLSDACLDALAEAVLAAVAAEPASAHAPDPATAAAADRQPSPLDRR